MLKMSLIAVASMIALVSVSGAEQFESKQEDENAFVAPNAEPAPNEAELSNRNAITIRGSARSNAGGMAVSQSGMRGPALAPVTPFVSYAPSGHAENDAEVQRQLQDIQDREQRLLQNPEYRDLLRAQQRLSLSQMHRDLPEYLEISKEQADQLFDLFAEQKVREQIESRTMRPRRDDMAAVRAFMEQIEERQRANEAEIAALLGPTKFEEWKDYEQSALARFMVQRLQNMLPEDARLRADQLRPLVRAIAREQRQMFEDRSLSLPQGYIPDEEFQKRMQERQLERMATANQRILDASASIISPRQLEQLESMLKQELDGHSQRQSIIGARAPLSPPSVLPPQRR